MRRRHVDQLVLDRLELRDGAAELLALFGIAQRGVVSALRHADRERGDGDAAAIEHPQAVDEAFAGFARAAARAAARQSVKITSPVALARMPSLFSFLPSAETRRVLFDDERGDAVLRAARSVTAMATQTSA